MAKYRANKFASFPYREGDIVEFKDPIVPGLKSRFDEYNGDLPVTDMSGRDPLRDPTAAGTQLNSGGKTPDGQTQNPEGEGGGEKTEVINPSREELKDEARSLGIDFAPNIGTEKLLELVKEAREKKAAE